jgi:hypothetical protein
MRTRQQTLQWFRELRVAARELRACKISPLQWQEAMDELFATVPLEGLCRQLGFDELKGKIVEKMPAERGEFFYRVVIPGTPRASRHEPKRALITKVAHVRKGCSIPPHSHSNMVSAFLCLSGEFDVQQFDLLEDRPHHLLVRRTTHEPRAGAGSWTSISDERDNVHWFTAKTDDCFLFSCKLNNLEAGKQFRGRAMIDIVRAETVGADTFLAPKITASEAAAIYGGNNNPQ